MTSAEWSSERHYVMSVQGFCVRKNLPQILPYLPYRLYVKQWFTNASHAKTAIFFLRTFHFSKLQRLQLPVAPHASMCICILT